MNIDKLKSLAKNVRTNRWHWDLNEFARRVGYPADRLDVKEQFLAFCAFNEVLYKLDDKVLEVVCNSAAAICPGDTVRCLDDSDGAHFLVAGNTYKVRSTQLDSNDDLRLNLVGMARAWEVKRFELVSPEMVEEAMSRR